MKTLDDIDLALKRAFVRVDFNVPLDINRRVKDDLRIQAVLPTIRKILDEKGKIILASHLGRPKGKPAEEFSLKPVGEYLADLLKLPVAMASDCVGEGVRKEVEGLTPGQILLLGKPPFSSGRGEERSGVFPPVGISGRSLCK